MGLTNNQKKILKYDLASSNVQSILTNAKVLNLPSNGYTNNIGLYNSLINTKLTQTEVFDPGSGTVLIAVALRDLNIEIYSMIFGNDVLTTNTPPIINHFTTQMCYTFSWYNDSEVITRSQYFTDWHAGAYDVLIFAYSKDSNEIGYWNFANNSFVRVSQSTFNRVYTNSTAYYNQDQYIYNPSTYRNAKEDRSIKYMKGVFHIPGAMPSNEIIKEFHDYIYNLFKPENKSLLKESNCQACNFSIPDPKLELTAFGLHQGYYLNHLGCNYLWNTAEYDNSVLSSSNYASASSYVTCLTFGNKGWGKMYPVTVTDYDMEAAGTSAYLPTSGTTSSLSKVTGSPSGSGSQVLHVERTTGNGYWDGLYWNMTTVEENSYQMSVNQDQSMFVETFMRAYSPEAAKYSLHCNIEGYELNSEYSSETSTTPTWIYYRRYIPICNYTAQITFRGTLTSIGSFIEADEIKSYVIKGTRPAVLFDGLGVTSDISNIWNNLKTNATWTMAFLFDAANNKRAANEGKSINYGRLLHCYANTDGTGVTRLIDFYYTSAGDLGIYTRNNTTEASSTYSYTADLTPKLCIYKYDGTYLSCYIENALIFSKATSYSDIQAMNKMYIGSFSGSSQFALFRMGGLWFWNSVVDNTIIDTAVRNMFPQYS